MPILVTGATGTVGAQVVQHLVQRGAEVAVLSRSPEKVRFAQGVRIVKGDMLDVDSMRGALDGITTLFLLNTVAPDELTQALITLNLARQAGIERLVYFSVIHSDLYVNVPHFASKYAAERMIAKLAMPATILRPAYFMNNDQAVKDVIVGHGVYPMPIGDVGLAMADRRDIAEIAALELLSRERSARVLPLDTIDVVGPESLTAATVAEIWSDVLGRRIVPAGSPASFEQSFRSFAPSWMAYDMRTMAERFFSDGMKPKDGDRERLVGMLGRPLRSYRAFAREVTAIPASLSLATAL